MRSTSLQGVSQVAQPIGRKIALAHDAGHSRRTRADRNGALLYTDGKRPSRHRFFEAARFSNWNYQKVGGRPAETSVYGPQCAAQPESAGDVFRAKLKAPRGPEGGSLKERRPFKRGESRVGWRARQGNR